MLNFDKKESLRSFETEVDGIMVRCHEGRVYDRKQGKFTEEREWRVSVFIENDRNYNSVELAVKSEEEAKAIAEDALKFYQSIRSVLLVDLKEDKED